MNKDAKDIQEGDKAPDFSLPDQDGRMIRLSDFKGRSVVLYFYPKDDTPGCTKEACGFSQEVDRFKKKNAVVLGVSFDGASSHMKFIQKYGLNFPLLSDEDKAAAKLYGVYKPKTFMGRNFLGIERSTFIIGPDGTLVKCFRKVKVDGHLEQVWEALG
ncbi:MAG: hypothetical protein A2636_06930 [Elusimicrobia bacterium RIFCSPHIGHO2_01_FULL_64_10]|nr:MAG: hypothetical protein A2636_06930 [Elusimicrobia bacterium RIFCSPHIGHO2_01_FULL_64_10]